PVPHVPYTLSLHDALPISEFLVGDSLLSAPIYELGAASRNVYLPAGSWFDYWSGDEYPGAGWSDVPAPLERWPLLVRGNTIIPRDRKSTRLNSSHQIISYA